MTHPDDDGGAVDGASVPVPDGEELAAFWHVARGRAGLGRLAVVIGAGARASVPPPASALGDTPQLADAVLARVLDGTKTATTVTVRELADAGQPPPEPGDLSILVDGRGHPRALVRTTAVRRVRLADVDAEHVAAEGEGDASVAAWTARVTAELRERSWASGADVGPDTEVVLERFEVRYPPRRRTGLPAPTAPQPAPVG